MRRLIFSGDVHGFFPALVNRITCEMDISDVDVVVCGDFGVGFNKSWDNVYKRVEPKLKKANCHFWIVRGNHDNPEYFNNEETYSKEYVTFMEDYKVYEIAGLKILPIGGAVSFDRNHSDRVEGKTWWPEEKVKRVDMKTLPVKVDIIVSHQAPGIFDPLHIKMFDEDDDLYNDVEEEREYLNQVVYTVTADRWYYGHYHDSYVGFYKDMKWKCLGIGPSPNYPPELEEFLGVEDPNPQGEIE